MADIAWTDWFDEVLPWVPKAPRQFVQNAVRDAAIELCAKGRVYLLESDPINTTINGKEYAWVKAGVTNVEVAELWEAKFKGLQLTFPTRSALKDLYDNWATMTGPPRHAIRLRPSVVRVVPYPIAADTASLVLNAFVMPTRNAVGIDEVIGEEYFETIGKGAKAKLMMSPKKPYTQMALGQSLQREFASEIAQHALAAEQGGTDADLEGSPEFF